MRALALVILFVSGTAFAQEVHTPARAVQNRGTLVLSDANRASVSFRIYNNQVGMRGQQLVLAPTLDVFASRHLTLGAALAIAYDHTSFAHSLELGGDARLGVYGALGRNWALWPTLALGAYRYTTTYPDDRSRVSLRARVDVPVLYYPAPGFFFGAGPLAGVLVQTSSGTFRHAVTLGLVTTLGGTF